MKTSSQILLIFCLVLGLCGAASQTTAARSIDSLIYLEQKVIASDGTTDNQFGNSVALSGNTALLGAPGHDVGIKVGQGAAYVFVRNGTTWHQQAELAAADSSKDSQFGIAVALSGDTAVIGAPYDDVGVHRRQGSVYVFERSGANWKEQAKLIAPDSAAFDEFGTSVALSNNMALVGAVNNDNSRGAVYVFVRSGTTWIQQAKLTASDSRPGDGFGSAVAVSDDTVLVGASSADNFRGVAYIFLHSGTTWNQQTELISSDRKVNDVFGSSVALSGDTALVGAFNKIGANAWQGSVYAFERHGTTWFEQQKLIAADGAEQDFFGYSIALSGDIALVGASCKKVGTNPVQGAAYFFVRNGTTWTEQQKIAASDGAPYSYFGNSVALFGDRALIGAFFDNVAQGSAYFFQSYRADTDLAVSIASSNPEPLYPGDTVALTTSVMNNGPDSANLVMLNVNLPEGVTYVFHATKFGIFTPKTGSWNIGDLPFGATATLIIQAKVNPIDTATKPLTFSARTLSIDLNNTNNAASLELTVNMLSTNGHLPGTGFAPGRVTTLPKQPLSKVYVGYNDLMLDIPALNIRLPIVGVPLSNGLWDISWLGNNAGYLYGTAFPTSSGNSVITGHVWNADNTPGVFAGIKKLKYGDKIFIHSYGQVYTYEVRDSLLVTPSSTNRVFQHEQLSWVTLLTCEGYNSVGDSYSYRRVVRAVLIGTSADTSSNHGH